MPKAEPHANDAIGPLEDAALLAALHAASFDRPWSRVAFDDFLRRAHVQAFGTAQGFILVQKIDAARGEILTLAVHPDARRGGLATRLIGHAAAALPAPRLLLDVAADNTGARKLYEKLGFIETGRRLAYYKNADDSRSDAVLMQGDFPASM